MRPVWLSVWMLTGGWAAAQELRINETAYDELMALKPTVETFDNHASASIRETLQIDHAQVGQILSGQSLQATTGRGLDSHWVLRDRSAKTPLALAPGGHAPIARVVYDTAFGTYALAGIGPEQSGAGNMQLGTGVVTILFDEPQCLFGLRTWLDGKQDNIVMRKFPEGNLNVILWDDAGEALADFRRFLDHGIVETGYIQSAGSVPAIRAVTIQNLDPDGIGIDEILYSPMCPMILS